jgi:hypothetical protein
VGAPDRPGTGFRDAEKTHLAFAHQGAHRADRVLDRHRRIDPVDIVEVDEFGAQPAQAALAGEPDIFRPTVGGRPTIGPSEIAELAGNDVFAPPPLDHAANQFLVTAVAIGIRGVEEVDAELWRAADRRDGFGRIRLPVNGVIVAQPKPIAGTSN